MSEKYSEQIIDSFLQELLTQQSPPDLSARISAAWEQERQQISQSPTEGTPLVRATPIAPANPIVPAKPVDPAAANLAATPGAMSAATSGSQPGLASSGKLYQHPRRRPGKPFGRNVIAALLAVSACGLLAFLGSRMVVKQHSGGPQTAQGEVSTLPGAPPSESAQVDLASKFNSADRPSSPGIARNGSGDNTSAAKPQPLELDNLPFALDATQPAVVSAEPTTAGSGEAGAASQAVLSDREIVVHIDQSLWQLWSDLQVVPAPPLPEPQRAERVVQLLTGQSADSSAANRPLPELVRVSTASTAFAQHWSSKLVRAWFAPGSLPLDDPRVVATEQRLANLILSGQAFNRVALDLLGEAIVPADKAAEQTTGDVSATATLVSALAGNGNHRLIARIGTNFLDTNLTCVRCHEANGASPTLPQQLQASAVARQEVYWSLVALLQGVEVAGGSGRQRVAVDRQPQQLAANKPLVAYYDLLDGRLQAAEPRLPGGQTWEQIAATQGAISSPRQALAQWLSQSSQMDEATVNLVWKIIMGRPLVAQIAWQTADQQEQLANRARRDLQLFLASQYRSHGHDLRQLVSWIVSSQTVGRQAQEVSRSQWLDASDVQLRQLQLAHWNFAAGPLGPLTAENNSLENSLATVIKWHSENGGTSDAGETTLAQPAPLLPPAPSKRRKAAGQQNRFTAPTMSYALHGEQPLSADVTFVSRLLASRRLSWQQCVEHVVLVNPDNVLTGRIEHLAGELLRQHSGDTQAALLDLLWAVKNADAL